MDYEKLLPEAPADMAQWLHKIHERGREALVYKIVRQRSEITKKMESRAECKCTYCGASWLAALRPNGSYPQVQTQIGFISNGNVTKCPECGENIEAAFSYRLHRHHIKSTIYPWTITKAEGCLIFTCWAAIHEITRDDDWMEIQKRNAYNITTRFEIEGDAAYKKNLGEITSQLKVNYAQMGLLTAQYDENATSQEALRAKSDALRAAMENQRAKVQLLTDKMKDSTAKTGAGSTATLNYQTSLTKAETELAKMQNQLNGYDKSMQSASKSSTSLADVANGLTSTLGISLPPAMQGAISKLDGVSASGAAAVGVITSLAVGLGKLTIDTAKTADNLLTLSSTTGLSTDELQEYEYAAELVDVSSETMQSSMTKMIKSMSAAKDGTGDAAEAYKELKIKVTDSHGALKDANTVFYQAIDALGKVKNETERDALSMSIFGKSARDLNPLIEAGSQKLKELGVEAHNVGYVMDNETLQQFGQLDDAMQRMEKQGDTLKNSLALALLPILTSLFETIGKIPVPVLQTIIVLTATIATVLLVVKAIKDVTNTAGAIKSFLDPANAQMMKTTAIIMGVAAAIIVVLALIAALSNKGGQVQQITSSIGNSVNSVTATTAAATQNYPRNARGSRFWVGGTTTVGEEGPEIVTLPRGSRIYPNGQGPKQSGGNTTNTYYVTIDAKNVREFNDIVTIAQNEATSIRQGGGTVGAV